MPRNLLISGLDIGSHAIRAVVAQKKGGSNQLSLLGVGEAPSAGLRRGVVVDSDEATLAVKEAVKNLMQMIPEEGGRKIAILGKMAECGVYEEQAHKELGELLAQSDIHQVIGVCEPISITLNQLPETIKKEYRDNRDGLKEDLLTSILKPNDIVLVKGSRWSTRLFEMVDEILSLMK